MGSVTTNLRVESPLHPAAFALLGEAFGQGWADPSKTVQSSRKSAILANNAKEIFASHLEVRIDQIHFLADASLGYHLGISGLLKPGGQLYYSGVDRSEVFAIAEGIPSTRLEVGLDGAIKYPEGSPIDVLCWQSANGETGIVAEPKFDFAGAVFVDASASGAHLPLPDHWDFALWNSIAWQGPKGLGVCAIKDPAKWHNPLPHTSHQIGGEFSSPLAILSAIALENYQRDYLANLAKCTALNLKIREFLWSQIPDVDIAGTLDSTLPHQLSFSFLYVDAGLLVEKLNAKGFEVDSGSACSSENMEPSHVLAAMGLLTHGNIRTTLRPDSLENSVDEFLLALRQSVEEIRS